MTGPDVSAPDPSPATSPRAIHDRRTHPTGVLPRRLQTWLMAGLAVVVILIILITGRPTPPARPSAGARVADAMIAPAERIRTYAQQLAAEATTPPAAPTSAMTGTAGKRGPNLSETGSGDDRRPARTGLLADNLVQSHRPDAGEALATAPARRPSPPATMPAGPADPSLAALAETLARLAPGSAGRNVSLPPPVASAIAPAPVTETRPPSTRSERDEAPRPSSEHPADGPRLTLFEGTVIDTVLLTRLTGALASPVTCLVTTPVYSSDRQHVVIPAGARVLGAAGAVQSWGDSRLAVSFHRLLMPDGHTYSLDLFKGLDAVGETGLSETVNHHYLQVFGASVAIGALAGLAQYDTHVGLDSTSFGDEYRQAAGASLAGSAGRVLDRYLNVLPTITIREGYRVEVYLTNDLELPVYGPAEGALP